MSEISKKVNEFFKYAIKSDIEELKKKIILSEYQEQLMNMKYIQRKTIDDIVYEFNYSKGKIEADLRTLRNKLIKILPNNLP